MVISSHLSADNFLRFKKLQDTTPHLHTRHISKQSVQQDHQNKIREENMNPV